MAALSYPVYSSQTYISGTTLTLEVVICSWSVLVWQHTEESIVQRHCWVISDCNDLKLNKADCIVFCSLIWMGNHLQMWRYMGTGWEQRGRSYAPVAGITDRSETCALYSLVMTQTCTEHIAGFLANLLYGIAISRSDVLGHYYLTPVLHACRVFGTSLLVHWTVRTAMSPNGTICLLLRMLAMTLNNWLPMQLQNPTTSSRSVFNHTMSIQRQRLESRDRACSALHLKPWTTKQLKVAVRASGVFYVNDDLRLIYCMVPKAACTTWTRVLLVASGKVSNDPSFTNFVLTGPPTSNYHLQLTLPRTVLSHINCRSCLKLSIRYVSWIALLVLFIGWNIIEFFCMCNDVLYKKLKIYLRKLSWKIMEVSNHEGICMTYTFTIIPWTLWRRTKNVS